MFHVCALLEIWCNVAFQVKSPPGDINRLLISLYFVNISLYHYHISITVLISIPPTSVECINTDFRLQYLQNVLFENETFSEHLDYYFLAQ